MNAGAMPMPDGVPPQAPNVWAVCFAVDDCDTAMAAGESLGGQGVPARHSDGTGPFRRTDRPDWRHGAGGFIRRVTAWPDSVGHAADSWALRLDRHLHLRHGQGAGLLRGLSAGETYDRTDGMGAHYLQFFLDGQLVAGLSQMPPEMAAEGCFRSGVVRRGRRMSTVFARRSATPVTR